MKYLPLNLCVPTVVGLSLLWAGAQPATAAVFHNGWQYAIDVSYDSLAGDGTGNIIAGGTVFESYGLAIKDDTETNTIWIGINSNLPITGNPVPGGIATTGNPVPNGNIGWGDLLFDFVDPTGEANFKTASDLSQLWGIHFAGNNDSGLPELGLYNNVRAKSVVTINDGWSNLYNNNVFGVQPRQSLDAWMGDLRWNDSYYSAYNSTAGAWANESSLMLSNIDSGNKVADITLRNQAELEDVGFDPSFFFKQGLEIFGFSFQKPLGFVGDFVATLLSECINDGMALLGNFVAPEPPLPSPPPSSEECPVTLGQLKSLIPDEEIEGEWKRFYDVASHKWYDPPAWTGMEIVGIGNTLFTQIYDFPCGISTDDKFTIYVNDFLIEDVGPGDDINFIDLVGGPISSFKIFWDESLVDPTGKLPFAIQLGTTEETGSFDIINISEAPPAKVPEPTSVISLAFLGISGWLSKRWLRQGK